MSQANSNLAPQSKVVVLMAAYNPDPPSLYRSMESILLSELPVDIVLIDDGSHCSVEELVRRQLPHSNNVIYINNDKNIGLTRSLNAGLKVIRDRDYKYIARMDVGDISDRIRFLKQFQLLESNQQIDGVGCWFSYFDVKTGKETKHIKTPTSPELFARKLKYNSAMPHSGWLLRSHVYFDLGGYDESYTVAQDYEFLTRAVRHGYRFVNLPEILLLCSENDGGITIKKRGRQFRARLAIQLASFEPLSVHSWAGVTRTAITMVIPAGIMDRIKRVIYRQ